MHRFSFFVAKLITVHCKNLENVSVQREKALSLRSSHKFYYRHLIVNFPSTVLCDICILNTEVETRITKFCDSFLMTKLVFPCQWTVFYKITCFYSISKLIYITSPKLLSRLFFIFSFYEQYLCNTTLVHIHSSFLGMNPWRQNYWTESCANL